MAARGNILGVVIVPGESGGIPILGRAKDGAVSAPLWTQGGIGLASHFSLIHLERRLFARFVDDPSDYVLVGGLLGMVVSSHQD
jgi:hypothetical protein